MPSILLVHNSSRTKSLKSTKLWVKPLQQYLLLGYNIYFSLQRHFVQRQHVLYTRSINLCISELLLLLGSRSTWKWRSAGVISCAWKANMTLGFSRSRIWQLILFLPLLQPGQTEKFSIKRKTIHSLKQTHNSFTASWCSSSFRKNAIRIQSQAILVERHRNEEQLDIRHNYACNLLDLAAIIMSWIVKYCS